MYGSTANRVRSKSMATLKSAFFNLHFSMCLLLVCCSAVLADSSVPTTDPLIRKAPTWHPPQVAEVKVQVVDWLEKVKDVKDVAVRGRALAIINSASDQATSSELLDRLAETFAVADPKIAELVEICSHPRNRLVLPTFAWLADPKTPPLVAANLRLYYGRWLVQGQWFEEALEQLGGVKTADVAAPAELLFYQGVTYHRMLNKAEGLKVLGQLIDGADFSPRRYIAVAYLMQSDLNSLEEETLDHIARRMEDVQRRLDLGRAGPKVRKVENGVVESLDKMIKKIEDGMKDQQPSNSLQSSSPAKDSTPMGGKAPGSVAKKDIGHKSGWGDMPPKEREEALQQMGRDFPPHYREAIEEYFRKLAAEGSSDDDK
jgi:hypothetical protein